MRMILETDRLPGIIQDFLRQADHLRKLIEKATWEVVEDIKVMLYDIESKALSFFPSFGEAHITTVARWLGSDKINLQSRYHVRLQDLRADKACDFLLTHPTFTNWYRSSDSQQLLLLGEMGYGKSVAMAFLVDELSRRSEHQLPRPKLCYYYCRDDKSGHADQIFSALVLSLLEQLSGLKKTFYVWYKENQASGILEPATSTRKLAEFLETVLETLDRPLFIMIDGLDECDRASRKAVLKLLGNLGQKTPRLKTVLSSRPEEEILQLLGRIASIDIGSDVHRDFVIAQHTVETQLSYLRADVRALVSDTLSRSAQGSSIWTKMTVELIELRGIRAMGPMRLFLKQIPLPEQLSDLYATLLARGSANDPESLVTAHTALKLLAVACRPLSIEELAWAVALSTAPRGLTTVAALGEVVDHQRVTSLIHPFITRIDFTDVKKRQVQLVHQSVRDFIRKQPHHLQGPSASTHQEFTNASTQDPEALVLAVCIRYLLLEEIDTSDLFSEEQLAIDALPQECDLFNDEESVDYDHYCTWEVWEEHMIRFDPTERGFGGFFAYASTYWLKHFAAITTEPLPTLADIETLCCAGSTRLQNWVAQYCRPNCAIKARFDFDSSLYDPLSITALYGPDTILNNMLQHADFNKDSYLSLPSLSTADQILQWGNLDRLKMLIIGAKPSHELRNLELFRLIIRHWAHIRTRHDNWEPAFELVDYVLDAMVEEKWGYELFIIATRASCMPITQRLLDHAKTNSRLKNELLRGS